MASRPEDDELTLDTPATDEEEQGEQEAPEQQEEQPPEEEDDIVFSDDPAEPKAGDSDLIKHLRNELKKTKQELAERPVPKAEPIEVGPRPTLEEFDWDEEKHAEAVDKWHERKDAAKAQKTDAEKQAEAANEAFQSDVQRFESARASLKVAGAPEAIETALASLSLVQRAVIVKAADNAATVLAALGKHPARLTELAAIEDPIKLATAIAKLEGKIQMTKRKAPEPEEVATGTANVRQGGDAQLEKLEKEAARTGDRSSLIAYKRNLKDRAKA